MTVIANLEEENAKLREAIASSILPIDLAVEYLQRYDGTSSYHGDSLIRALSKMKEAIA